MDQPFSAEDLVRQYTQGVRDFTGVNLFRAKLTGVVLEGIILLNAYLIGADLSRANFRNANLRGVCLVHANLQGTDLRNANLRPGRLNSGPVASKKEFPRIQNPALLYDADLSGANLMRADLFGANLVAVKLTGANLHETNLREANLCAARVTDEQLSWAASLEGAWLPDGSKKSESLEGN
jgi:uncharacterized protein YjbI with pentapeptide repeats